MSELWPGLSRRNEFSKILLAGKGYDETRWTHDGPLNEDMVRMSARRRGREGDQAHVAAATVPAAAAAALTGHAHHFARNWIIAGTPPWDPIQLTKMDSNLD